MQFEFTDEQRFLQNQISTQIAKICPLERSLNILCEDSSDRNELWKEFISIGYPGLGIPLEYGGHGYGYLELCLLAQELGRMCVSSPMSSNIYMAAQAILLYGSEQQKNDYLPRIGSGELVGTLAWSENLYHGNSMDVTCTHDSGLINGKKVPVADGEIADFFIVLCRTGDSIGWFLVNSGEQGVTIKNVDVIDSSWPHSIIEFNNVKASPLTNNNYKYDEVFYRASILTAFEQIGGTEMCIDLSCNYARERKSSGRAIGSFQSIKHKLADIFCAKELALSHAYFAAWSLSTNDAELHKASASARISATRAYELASAEAIQIHGALGFTWESYCHMFYKRSRMLAALLGGEHVWQTRLIQELTCPI